MKKRMESKPGTILKRLDNPRTAVILAGLAVILLAVLIPVLCIRHNREIRQYSGAETDDHEQLNFDVGALEEFSDGGMEMHPDGTYSRMLLLKHGIELRLWRDRERPRLPLREQIKEKYPDLAKYNTLSVEGHSAYLAEKCSFGADGRRHTAALIRRGGWDYLIDLSSSDGQEEYTAYIDRILDTLFFL